MSATSTAASISSVAAEARRSRLKVIDSSIPRAAAKDSSSVSTASKRCSLSSCMSLLYVSGKACITPWSPARWDTIRGAFARSSSAASGFFFCGMIDDEEAQSSRTSQNPNSSELHSTISAPSRDRCVAQVAAAFR